jgi:hypothetical protein
VPTTYYESIPAAFVGAPDELAHFVKVAWAPTRSHLEETALGKGFDHLLLDLRRLPKRIDFEKLVADLESMLKRVKSSPRAFCDEIAS